MTKTEEQIFMDHRILAIAPYYHEKYASVIHTTNAQHFSTDSGTKNIELYCLLNGSSLEGRKHSSRKRYKDVKNPSIIVSELNAIVAFQVPGPNFLDTIWICDVATAVIESTPDNGSVITLSNQAKLYSPLAASLVEKRRKKALRLLYSLAYLYFQRNFSNPPS